MVARNIAYIRTEPLVRVEGQNTRGPNYRCTIELLDGSTLMRCGVTCEHALENAVAFYKRKYPPK